MEYERKGTASRSEAALRVRPEAGVLTLKYGIWQYTKLIPYHKWIPYIENKQPPRLGIFPSFPSFILTDSQKCHIIVFRMPTTSRASLPYLRTAEVADILMVTKRTLKNWLRREFIPEPQRNPSNRYRLWTLADIEAVRRLLQERDGAK